MSKNPTSRQPIETGVLGRAYAKDLEAIRDDQHAKHVEYFTYHLGVREDDPRDVPHDLRDTQSGSQVTSNLAPISSVVKNGKGDEDEIAHGGSSLVESLIFYSHPFFTLASMLIVAFLFGGSPLLGLAFFLGAQAAYAHFTIPLFGRNWRYNMRPTVNTTVSIGMVQVLLAMVLPPSWVAPLLIVGNIAMLARPFLEGRHVTRGLGRRPLPVQGYFPPDLRDEKKRRAEQIEGAKSLEKNGPFITLGYATGRFREEGHPFAPDKGAPMGASVSDFGKHLAVFGSTGVGKTYGTARPFAQQWMALGTKRTIIANGVKQIVWRNSGGMFIMDGKAELGRDLIRDARKMSMEKLGIELIEIGTGDGCVPMAILEGQKPVDLAQALADIAGQEKGGNPFFTASTYKWIQVAGTLLEAAIDVQTVRLDAIAQNLKHPSTGEVLGYTSYKHVLDTYKKAGKPLPQWVRDTFKRDFIWIWPHFEDMCKDFILDRVFLEGKLPLDSNGKEITSFVSHAPKMPAGGLVAQLKELDYYKAGDAKGVMLDTAIKYATRFLPDMELETRKNILATVGSWLDTASTCEALIDWLQLETGADVTACMRGGMVALSLSVTEHKKAGQFFLNLAKRRFFNAMLSRPSDWANDPTQRPVLLEVDEAQSFISRDGGSPEEAILQMARSKGCVAFYLTQSYAEYANRLGEAGAKAFAGNFNSFITFEAELSTKEWVRDRIGTHRLFEFKGLNAGDVAHDKLMPQTTVDDQNAMQRLHAENAFALTYPTDVVLTDDDKKELDDDGHKSHTGLHMRAHLARMFTLDLVLKAVPEAIGAMKADLVLLQAWVKRQYHAVLRKSGAKTKTEDEKAVTPIPFSAHEKDEVSGDNSIEPFFNSRRYGLLKGNFVCVASFKRGGGAVREDVMESIGVLTNRKIRDLASLQPGVVTVFDELDRLGIAYDQAA